MVKAHVYAVNEPPYRFVVVYRRKGAKAYKRRFRLREDAEADCAAFNARLEAEGTAGLHIGARERVQIERALSILEGTGLSMPGIPTNRVR